MPYANSGTWEPCILRDEVNSVASSWGNAPDLFVWAEGLWHNTKEQPNIITYQVLFFFLMTRAIDGHCHSVTRDKFMHCIDAGSLNLRPNLSMDSRENQLETIYSSVLKHRMREIISTFFSVTHRMLAVRMTSTHPNYMFQCRTISIHV